MPISNHRSFNKSVMPQINIMEYYSSFRKAILLLEVSCIRVTHPCATRQQISKLIPVTVRLACVRPAASVHPEPGSNSPL